jgi:hypothetical protein
VGLIRQIHKGSLVPPHQRERQPHRVLSTVAPPAPLSVFL